VQRSGLSHGVSWEAIPCTVGEILTVIAGIPREFRETGHARG
jgi:hypothetical protein